MAEKLIVGPISKGFRNDVTSFNIDNDSFPTLVNAYQWRGRIRRKRGTTFLTRLKRFLGTTNGAGSLTVAISPASVLIPIPTGIVSFVIGTDIFTDPGTTANPADQILLTNGSAVIKTFNRTTGVLTITGSIPSTNVFYYPSLPVMGLEELNLDATQFPGTLGFDTTYAYNILTTDPYLSYDISFYKNPALNGTTLPGYTPKGSNTPLWWNGQDYQQFWTCNYQGALWATNGIEVPFDKTNVGMQYKFVTNIAAIVAGPPATATLTITAHGLVVGDFLFMNEFPVAPPAPPVTGINFQTGYVIAVIDVNNVSVEFPFATLGGAGGVIPADTAIAQYLTNRSDATKDCIRFYDGDPTNGDAVNPAFQQGHGWVNFAPPLSQDIFSIADKTAAKYYLAGARIILPFKDRLLFIGPIIQTKVANSQIYLQDTIIYSQNGTPYYTASYTNRPSAAVDTPTNPPLTPPGFVPILVPNDQTATPSAWFEDATGFGGFTSANIAQPIITAAANGDVLIIGFSDVQTQLVYSGDDISPFNFFLINSEYGSGSTFSSIKLDRGVYTRGQRGFVITSQTNAERIDLEIPDEVFSIALLNNGNERFTAQRDFINEWIYFTYPSNQYLKKFPDDREQKFPTQTLQFNYRDNSWAVFYETYTTYGSFRKTTGLTWNTLDPSLTWKSWNAPWDSNTTTLFQPEVIGGNQQGFVLVRDTGTTDEGNSLTIQNILANVVTSPNHSLNNGDYITISGALGAVGTQVNGKVFSVFSVTNDTFKLNPAIDALAATYNGGGLIKRFYVPYIQTKQFPSAWGMGRKTRIGVQRYLLTNTENSQITLLIFLSQNNENSYNNIEYPLPVQITPNASLNNSLIYSTTLYTCPESTNLGLTPANINLQTPTALNQSEIWHRINTSLIGDTIQLGFTMNDEQMRDETFENQISEIELHGFILDIQPSQMLV